MTVLVDTQATTWDDLTKKGGAGSGNWGHAGRRGLVGGSASARGTAPSGATRFAAGNISRNDAIAAFGLRDGTHLNQMIKNGIPSVKVGKRRYIVWPDAKVWMDEYNAAGKGRTGIAAANAAVAAHRGGAATTTAPPTTTTAPPTTTTTAPPTKTSKYYQGDLNTATAEQIYKGSSPEVQNLANKTGIIATCDFTYAYVEGKQSEFQFETTVKGLTKTIANMNVNRIYDKLDRWQDAKTYDPTKEDSTWDHPVSSTRNLVSLERDGSPRTWFDGADKLPQGHQDAIVANAKLYRHYDDTISPSMGYTAKYKEIQKSVWNDLSSDHREALLDVACRAEVVQQISRAAGKGMRYDSGFTNMKLGDIPAGTKLNRSTFDIQVEAQQWRNNFLRNPKKIGTRQVNPKNMMAIVNPSTAERKGVEARLSSTWDNVNHGHFSFKPYRIWKVVGSKSHQDKFTKAKAKYGNIVEPKAADKAGYDALYHGTHYGVAQKIGSNGFIVPKSVKTGRMMGDGVYLANNASKSAQYIGSGWGRSGGVRGILFECSAAKGRQVEWTGRNTHTSHGGGVDTLFAGKRPPAGSWGRRTLLNDELIVRDPAAVVPYYWIDGTRN